MSDTEPEDTGAIDRAVVSMTIDDAEHLTDEQRARIIASYPEHEREARLKGIPALGSGAVFPIEESLIRCEPFSPPKWWRRLIAIDFGIDHPFAAVKLAHDPDNDVIYIGREYRRRRATVADHAAVLREFGGDEIPIAWPHDGEQRDDRDMKSKASLYADQGLAMLPKHATHEDGGYATEPGIMNMLVRMQEGRLKVFSTCQMWFDEFRNYHRKDGIINKIDDDLMSATRIGVMAIRYAEEPRASLEAFRRQSIRENSGRNNVTGY